MKVVQITIRNCECCPHHADNAFPAMAAELEELRKENDSLRFRLAHGSADCVYCHLPAADMGKCERGFPGCARADDMMAAPEIPGATDQRDEALKLALEALEHCKWQFDSHSGEQVSAAICDDAIAVIKEAQR